MDLKNLKLQSGFSEPSDRVFCDQEDGDRSRIMIIKWKGCLRLPGRLEKGDFKGDKKEGSATCKVRKPLILMVPEARLELARGCPRWILSPLRLPFHHSGVRRRS